ncbi:MAG: DUF1015 family protein [Nocardioides sp.]
MDSGQVVVAAPPYLATPFRLEPFRALMLAPYRVGDPGSARAFARPYRDVTERLSRWEAAGRVHRDAVPALYLHEYTAGGITVRGLVGALDLTRRAADLTHRAVYPHEGFHADRARDLAGRMHEMRLNPAPIVLVHRGPDQAREICRRTLLRAPDVRFTDRAQQRHRLWALRGAEQSALQEALAESRPLIADGHHRHAAYLQLQSSYPGTTWDHGLAMVVDQTETPLFLGAIHRLLRHVTLAALGDAVAAGPHALESSSRAAALDELGAECLAVTDGRSWAVLRLTLAPHRSAVEELHATILPALAQTAPAVEFHHSVEDTMRHVRRDRDVAVLMPAIDFDQVAYVVAHDHLLPEKATSFQPKPSTGVLMRSLDDG